MLPLLFVLGFTALVVMIVLLRAPKGSGIENRIDTLEGRLAEEAERLGHQELAWPLRLLLQSIGFALVAAERSAPDAALVAPKLLESLENQGLPELLEGLAGEAPESAAARQARGLLDLRRTLGRFLVKELAQDAEAGREAPRWLALLEPAPESAAPNAPLASVSAEAEERAWPAIEAAARRLSHVRWAFEETGLQPAIAPAFEAALWTLQGVGPALAARGWHSARELEDTAGALAQLIAAAHTGARLAAEAGPREREAENDADAEAERDRAFFALARREVIAAIAALDQWIIEALQGPPAESLQVLSERLRARARAVLEKTPSSPRLRVQEMLLAHPRGPAAVEVFSLKCVGCLLAEREDLRSACLTHDLELVALMRHLRGQPAETGAAEA